MHGRLYAPHPAVSAMEIDHEVTLYHRESQAAVMLNDSASAVWRLLDGRRTVGDIVEELTDQYRADTESVAGGVGDVLETLEQHGLVEVAG